MCGMRIQRRRSNLARAARTPLRTTHPKSRRRQMRLATARWTPCQAEVGRTIPPCMPAAAGAADRFRRQLAPPYLLEQQLLSNPRRLGAPGRWRASSRDAARGLAFAQPRRPRSYPATGTAFRHRPLAGPKPAASCEAQRLIGGYGYLEAVKCRRCKRAVG
jgi:hypothetical protein